MDQLIINMYKVKLTIPNKKTTFVVEYDFKAENIQQAMRLAEIKYPELEIISIVKKQLYDSRT